MAKASPPPATAPRTAAPAAASTARPWVLLAVVGWAAAVIAGIVAYGQHAMFASQKQKALDEQAAGYEQKLQQMKAEIESTKAAADAKVKKTQDDALASQASMQAELDFQRLPELPLDAVFRAGPALYVENKGADVLACKVRLTRPSLSQTKEPDFEIKPHAYQDLGAIGGWVFAKGDKVEFIKPGFKPHLLEAP